MEPARIRTWITTVRAVERLSPTLMQITCGGGDLRDFRPLGPDTFVFVLAPPAGRAELTIDRDFTWTAYEQMAPADRPVGAYYTVRRWRLGEGEVDLVVVVHPGPGEGSAWAARARPGDPVALWGPREVFDPPTDTDRYLLVGDETAVHAVGAILEWLPLDAAIDVVVEVDTVADHVPLRVGPNCRVRWCHRDGAPAGGAVLLADAVGAIDLGDGAIYAWGGAESRVVTVVRRYLRDVVGLPREAVAMTAYWRQTLDESADTLPE